LRSFDPSITSRGGAICPGRTGRWVAERAEREDALDEGGVGRCSVIVTRGPLVAIGHSSPLWPNSPHLKHFLPLPGRLRALPRRPRELPREERGVVHRDEVPDPPPKSSAGSFGIAVAIGEKN